MPEIVDGLQREFGDERRRFVRLDVTTDPLPAADVFSSAGTVSGISPTTTAGS